MEVGVYDVWAVVEIDEQICISQKYEVEIDDFYDVERQDIYIYIEDCD